MVEWQLIKDILKYNSIMPKILSLIVLALFLSCCCNIKETKVDKSLEKDTFEYVHLIPDSLRTVEQEELFLLLQKTITENLQVRDNHLYFILSENDFVKRGIPIQYYNKLQQDLDDANHFIDLKGIERVDTILNMYYKK